MSLFSHSVVSSALLFACSSSSSISSHTIGDPLSSSCLGKTDGDYWLLLSSDSVDYTPVHLRCSNEYVILDVSKDSNLINYFSSWEKWHHSIGGPPNHDAVNWREWFLYTSSVNYNRNSKYLLSPDCNICDSSYKGQVKAGCPPREKYIVLSSMFLMVWLTIIVLSFNS